MGRRLVKKLTVVHKMSRYLFIYYRISLIIAMLVKCKTITKNKAKKIKSDYFTRSNIKKTNIAVAKLKE